MIPRVAVYAAAAVAAAALSFAAAAARPDDGDEATAPDGAALFRIACMSCHDGPDRTSMIGAGPSLADAPSWAAERIDGVSAEDYLEQSMRSPSAFISPMYRPIGGPSDGMPLLQLSDTEIAALVDYLLNDDRPGRSTRTGGAPRTMKRNFCGRPRVAMPRRSAGSSPVIGSSALLVATVLFGDSSTPMTSSSGE